MTRYTDDYLICCKTQKGAKRVLGGVTRLLERELGLQVHPEKTKIVNHREESFVFLGHEFKPGYWGMTVEEGQEDAQGASKGDGPSIPDGERGDADPEEFEPLSARMGELLWMGPCQGANE